VSVATSTYTPSLFSTCPRRPGLSDGAGGLGRLQRLKRCPCAKDLGGHYDVLNDTACLHLPHAARGSARSTPASAHLYDCGPAVRGEGAGSAVRGRGSGLVRGVEAAADVRGAYRDPQRIHGKEPRLRLRLRRARAGLAQRRCKHLFGARLTYGPKCVGAYVRAAYSRAALEGSRADPARSGASLSFSAYNSLFRPPFLDLCLAIHPSLPSSLCIVHMGHQPAQACPSGADMSAAARRGAHAARGGAGPDDAAAPAPAGRVWRRQAGGRRRRGGGPAPGPPAPRPSPTPPAHACVTRTYTGTRGRARARMCVRLRVRAHVCARACASGQVMP
jgi:hypothetical protein